MRAPDRSRFDSQFWVANVNPTDRYTQSIPGSAEHRISPLDNTYDNLTVAGDWTELRAQSRLRRGGGDVGAAGGACAVRFAGAGRHHWVRSSLSGGRPLTIGEAEMATICETRRPAGAHRVPIGRRADLRRPTGAHRRVINRAVKLAYGVVDDHILQGQRAAERLRQGTYSSADFDQDLRALPRSRAQAVEGVGAWGWIFSTWFGAWPGPAGPDPSAPDVALEVKSKRRAEVKFHLRPGLSRFNPLVPPIHSADKTKDPLKDVHFAFRDGEPSCSRCQHSGRPTTRRLSRRDRRFKTHEPQGFISVRVIEEDNH